MFRVEEAQRLQSTAGWGADFSLLLSGVVEKTIQMEHFGIKVPAMNVCFILFYFIFLKNSQAQLKKSVK